ncbi:fasciclin domain-containing protein [Paraflavisolibacter sp. H34]|uniref:fasciclin domain-containing protein n=1 Tax=Huijunlia imazamoxiresistens TaxID=3127457 RepID=UPI00301AC311
MNKLCLWVVSSALCLAGCKKRDDYYQAESQDMTRTLLEEISQHPNLSNFYELLKKTGLDKELASSKTYTVWAPTNEALGVVDAAILADSARLRQFIANHISYQAFFTRNAQTAVRVPMLNGKRVVFQHTKFDEATIVEKDRYVGNGVLQVIDKKAPVYPNAWELVNRGSDDQSKFILSLTRKVFDATNAIVDSISQTGRPIYRPGTDSVLRNSFNTEVYDLQNEEKQYTYFILDNSAFQAESAKLNPYFKTSTTDSTNALASFAVAKDLIVEGVYTQDQLPAVLTSKFGVKIPIDKSQIAASEKLSNGIAYVIRGINFDVKDKIPTVVVQGENYRGFFDLNGNPVTPRQNNVSAIFTRYRATPSGTPFIDMFAYNHGITGLSALYRTGNLASVKYKVYWHAPNDTLSVNGTIAPAVFNQRLAMGTFGTNFLPDATGKAVAVNNYSEVYIGDWVQSSFGPLNMWLAAPAATTGQPAGVRLNLDYIKLVPEL